MTQETAERPTNELRATPTETLRAELDSLAYYFWPAGLMPPHGRMRVLAAELARRDCQNEAAHARHGDGTLRTSPFPTAIADDPAVPPSRAKPEEWPLGPCRVRHKSTGDIEPATVYDEPRGGRTVRMLGLASGVKGPVGYKGNPWERVDGRTDRT